MSEADRSLVAVMSRVMGPQRLEAYAEMLRSATADPTDGEFDSLPADADDATRQSLAERMAPHIRRIQAEHPEMAAPYADDPRGPRFVAAIAAAAMQELYSPAQIDVFRRVHALLTNDREGRS
jgi:hypothetical protein